ncbi:hypothetical protein [Nocardioides sp. TF02-7]|nr:hypothetical protein [Nocardioides sp. TF02-7]
MKPRITPTGAQQTRLLISAPIETPSVLVVCGPPGAPPGAP